MDGSMGWMLLCIAEDLGIKNNGKERGEQAIKKRNGGFCARRLVFKEKKNQY
jgi:hypothetical protein